MNPDGKNLRREAAADASAVGTAPEFQTAGERLVGRVLRKEVRGAVAHFVPGQHEAVVYPMGEEFPTGEPIQVGRLAYVDTMGHACVVLVMRSATDEPWIPTWIGRAGQHTAIEATRPPAAFVLSERMLAALASARHVDWPDGTTDDGSPSSPTSESDSPSRGGSGGSR